MSSSFASDARTPAKGHHVSGGLAGYASRRTPGEGDAGALATRGSAVRERHPMSGYTERHWAAPSNALAGEGGERRPTEGIA